MFNCIVKLNQVFCLTKIIFASLEGSRIDNSENQPQNERWQTVDEEKLAPLKEFIALKGNNLLCSPPSYLCSFIKKAQHSGCRISYK